MANNLEEYKILYKKDSNNTNGDALSGYMSLKAVLSHDNKSGIKNKENNSGIKVDENKPGLKQEEKLAIFKEMNYKSIGGHLGMNRTYERLKLLRGQA
jgi:hypothetical protein